MGIAMHKRHPALSEAEVLKRLNISDFRHLSKETVMQFATTLPLMDSDVAKKALEQFPDFARTVLESMEDCKESVDKAILESGKDAERLSALYSSMIDALKMEIGKEDIPFEQKQYWLEQMKEVAEMAYEAKRESDGFRLKALTVLGGVAVFGMGILAVALGSNVDVAELAEKVSD